MEITGYFWTCVARCSFLMTRPSVLKKLAWVFLATPASTAAKTGNKNDISTMEQLFHEP
jgi:hypothetical protein